MTPKWLSGSYRKVANGPIPHFDHGDNSKLILPVGANMAFRRSAFEKYGLFRTDMGMGSRGTQLGADFEFCLRLLRAGETIVYSPKAVVFHPAEPHRLTKAYFLRFYYYAGRADVRLGLETWTPATVLYWGIPRWMFRTLFKQAMAWLLAFGAKRFSYKTRLYRLAGQMREAHILSSEQSPQSRPTH